MNHVAVIGVRVRTAVRIDGAADAVNGDIMLVVQATPAERFAAVLDLYAFAVAQMRANLRRRNPDASKQEIEELLAEWAVRRSCAPHGDSVGRTIQLSL